MASAVPGSLRIVDINDDGVINDKDRTEIGNPFPTATWGFTNTLTWKGFDLYVMIQEFTDWMYSTVTVTLPKPRSSTATT
ncbi:hypothetical protein SFC43_34725 [Bacteroides sp. CR5/BHMF/2]|nr:hypothetical protein [Bacteroides sp. CR5/BHMF/2]